MLRYYDNYIWVFIPQIDSVIHIPASSSITISFIIMVCFLFIDIIYFIAITEIKIVKTQKCWNMNPSKKIQYNATKEPTVPGELWT